ncbi:MAG TPA: Nramp family divalent metal transporter [Balneolales bacterium]|nr:Nramp family divalent metal transporter [Balneolales bacterium]
MNWRPNIESSHLSLEDVHSTVDTINQKSNWKRILAFLGPAYLVSVGYMDPGNWATDIAGGSRFAYDLIWVLLLSNMMAVLLQYLSAKLGLVRGRDLAQASRETYPPVVNFILYLLAEIAIAATDLAEVLGMAIGLNLLFGLPLLIGVSITVLDTFLLLVFQRYGMRKMEAFIVGLISIIGISFLINLIMAKPDMGQVVTGFIPTLANSQALYIAIGIIGATVMPHNLYLHSALVQTRKIDPSTSGLKKAIKYNLFDSVIALNLAFFVNAAILVLAAATFYTSGHFHVAGIQQAHHLLQPLLGSTLAPILFAIALIAAGQSSTITGTMAGQIVMEGYLHLRIQPWMRRLITRLLAIIPAFLTILYMGPKASDELLILSQVILSLQLGFAIIPLIHFVSDKEKMKGENIGLWVKIASWVTAIIIIALNVKLVLNTFSEWMTSTQMLWIQIPVLVIAIGSGFLLLYITFRPLISRRKFFLSTPHPNAEIPLGHLIEAKPFKRIAVTVDFSKSDLNAISRSISQGHSDAEYIIIHVVDSAGARMIGGEISDFESEMDRKKLEEYVETLKVKGYKTSYKIGFGDPKKEIPALVKSAKADMLVMGAHGHRKVKDLILGETVDTVRHNVDIPVLIV